MPHDYPICPLSLRPQDRLLQFRLHLATLCHIHFLPGTTSTIFCEAARSRKGHRFVWQMVGEIVWQNIAGWFGCVSVNCNVMGWGTATMHIWWRAGPNPIILHFSCLGLSLVIYNKIYLKYSQTCSIYLMISSDILRDLMNCLVMFRVEMWCVKICQDAPHMSIVCETPR